jgi:transcriptional regulator with XRE-family HTH domain
VWVQPQDHRIVGRCLADARRQAGVSQDDLAARLGKPQSFVSTYESGQRRVDILEFLLILKTLGVDPASVFTAIVEGSRSLIAGYNSKK